MEIEISQVVLQILLDKTGHLLQTKDLKPILTNYFVSAEDGVVTVVGSNLELSVTAQTDNVEVKETGNVLLPAGVFSNIIKSIGDKEVILLSVKDSRVVVKAKGAKWEFATNTAVDEYPQLPDYEVDSKLMVDKGDFLEKVSKVLIAVSRDTKRPQMQLVNFSDNLMVASDGAQYQEAAFDFSGSMVIPLLVLEELVRFLKLSHCEHFTIGQSENIISVLADGDCFVGAKSVADFPDVSRIKDAVSENSSIVSAQKSILLNAIRRVMILSNQETNAVKLSVSEDSGVFSCEDKFGNQAKESITLFYDGEPRDLQVNGNFFIKLLLSSTSPDIQLYLGEDVGMRKSYIQLKEENHIGIISQIVG